MEIESLNSKVYTDLPITDLPIDELNERLLLEELEDKLELSCWSGCDICYCTNIGYAGPVG